MKKILLLLILLPLAGIAQPYDKITRIDSVLTYLHQRQLFNGTVLIGENGKVRYKKAFGIADPKTLAPLTTQSSFNLASVSKQFFAMMIMILKERGQLMYDDPVQKHLPAFPYHEITIRHLLNQTSGLPEYFDIAAANMNPLDTLTNQAMLALLAAKKPPLVFKPGEQWQYCNTNYTTLASIIQQVSGTTPEQFFQQNISAPLKLKESYIWHLKLKSSPPSRVFGFQVQEGKPVLNDLMRLDGIIGDGNVYASVEDLYRWDQALYGEKLVKKSTLHEAFTAGKLNNGNTHGYGFAWSVNEPGKKVSHSGSWVGFRTYIVRYIDKNQTLIILDNSGNSYCRAALQNIWEGLPYQLPETHLITNVKVLDGTGLSAFNGSVRILNNRIHDIGNLTPFPGEPVTDGHGQVLAPGFIDSHSHHDGGLFTNSSALAVTNQGITTVVVGQDGGSTPIDSIQLALKSTPVSVNIATYTGHAWLREKFMRGSVYRKATAVEIDSMKALLLREMDKGSLGLSTGLEYEAAFYSNREEVVELAKAAATKQGRYISHIRSEDLNIEDALDEIITIGQEANIPVQVTHIKIAMRSKWGNSGKILQQMQAARAHGINITADIYPYTMWNSTPRVLFPKKDFNNLASATFATQELFDPAASFMVRYSPQPQWQGKTVAEIATINNETPAHALLRIIRESAAPAQSATIVAKSMSEADISNFMQWPYTSLCTDGTMRGHPRGHGSFTRVLGRYVREQKLMPLETAIQKMTSLAAENAGIKNRGLIKPGYFADLVLFNPDTVLDNATIENPTALSTGISAVWVNGKMVYLNQKAVANYPGVFITR